MLYLDQLRIWKFIENSVLQDEKKSGQFSGQFWRIIYRLSQALVVVLAQKFVGKHKRRCSTWIRRVFGNSSKTPPYRMDSRLRHFLRHFEKLIYRFTQALVVVLPQKFVGKHKRRCSTWISWGFENSSKTPPYKAKIKAKKCTNTLWNTLLRIDVKSYSKYLFFEYFGQIYHNLDLLALRL